MNTGTLSYAKQASYRALAGRYGVRRIAEILREKGVPLWAAIAILATKRNVASAGD